MNMSEAYQQGKTEMTVGEELYLVHLRRSAGESREKSAGEKMEKDPEIAFSNVRLPQIRG